MKLAASLALALAAPLSLLGSSAPATAVSTDTGARFVPYTGAQWIQDLVSVVDDMPEHVSFDITDVDNCGSAISPRGTGGGCTHHERGHTVIDISPSALFTASGVHIVYHEIGHAMGIRSECKAEEFAHQYSDPNAWSYPSCMAGVEPTR